jgi:hypothetical protein
LVLKKRKQLITIRCPWKNSRFGRDKRPRLSKFELHALRIREKSRREIADFGDDLDRIILPDLDFFRKEIKVVVPDLMMIAGEPTNRVALERLLHLISVREMTEDGLMVIVNDRKRSKGIEIDPQMLEKIRIDPEFLVKLLKKENAFD